MKNRQFSVENCRYLVEQMRQNQNQKRFSKQPVLGCFLYFWGEYSRIAGSCYQCWRWCKNSHRTGVQNGRRCWLDFSFWLHLKAAEKRVICASDMSLWHNWQPMMRRTVWPEGTHFPPARGELWKCCFRSDWFSICKWESDRRIWWTWILGQRNQAQTARCSFRGQRGCTQSQSDPQFRCHLDPDQCTLSSPLLQDRWWSKEI